MMERQASYTGSSGSSPRRLSPSSSGLLNGDRKKPFLIGVAGGTASGKSSVCKKIMEAVLGQPEIDANKRSIISLSQDSFYRELNEEDLKLAKKGHFNFDHPDAFDYGMMLSCLKSIREGKPTQVPVYDYKTNSREKGKFTIIDPSDVVLFEGILVFYNVDIREMFDMKLFVDTDADTRLARRVLRDIEDRGRDLETILTQYTSLVKPAFEEFCLPTKKFADVIIPRGAENTVAIELVAQHILDIILARKAEEEAYNNNSSSQTKQQDSPFTRSRSNSDSMIR